MSNKTRNTESITSKGWSFCNPRRDVGVGYGDYLEQLTRNICQFVGKANVAFFATVPTEGKREYLDGLKSISAI